MTLVYSAIYALKTLRIYSCQSLERELGDIRAQFIFKIFTSYGIDIYIRQILFKGLIKKCAKCKWQEAGHNFSIFLAQNEIIYIKKLP